MTSRISMTWSDPTHAQLDLHGRLDAAVVDRLDRFLDLVLRTDGTTLTVDLSRLEGPDTPVLEALTIACRRLWLRRGSMHVVGLGNRLAAGRGPVVVAVHDTPDERLDEARIA